MKHLFWKLLVLTFLGLAYLGAILPGLPTTVFLILATWAASKGWPEYYTKLLNHPKYGHLLRNWREHGTVPRKVKYLAIGMMTISMILLFIFNLPIWIKLLSIGSMLLVAIWLILRPEPNPTMENTYMNLTQPLTMNTPLAEAHIIIDLAQQQLYLPKFNKYYPISSAKNGIGEQINSGQTPRGWHCISEKIGDNLPENSVFVARQATGEIYTPELAETYPQRDWILTRILWLDGLEQGYNRGENPAGQCCDSKQRYIYIHGTPDSEPMGIPRSHGCIRMRNTDIIELYSLITEHDLVYISEEKIDLH